MIKMHIFDDDMKLTMEKPGLFTGKITENWSINDVPNGGYIMALITEAMKRSSDKTDTPILTSNYLAKCTPGAIEIQVKVLSRSKQFTRFEATLLQEGQEKVRSLGTFAQSKDECFIEQVEATIPETAPLEECIAVPAFEKYTLYNHMDVRLDPRCAGWMDGKLTEKSEQCGWIKFKHDRPFCMASIALIADSFPPAVLATQGMIAWVPTIEFSVNIRNIPQTKWLKCLFRTRFINCGLVEEDGEIWDEEGIIIALSRQIAQFRVAH